MINMTSSAWFLLSSLAGRGCDASSQTLCSQICSAQTYLGRIYWRAVFYRIPPPVTGCSVKRSRNKVRCIGHLSLWPAPRIRQFGSCYRKSVGDQQEKLAYLKREWNNTLINSYQCKYSNALNYKIIQILLSIFKLILQFEVITEDLPVSGSVNTSMVGSSDVVRKGTGSAAIGPCKGCSQ